MFIVGNGTEVGGYYNRSNAMVVKQSGKVGLSTNTPHNTLQVGENGDGTSVRANAWLTFSDKRWKKDFAIILNSLEKLSQINGYYYHWDLDEERKLQSGNKNDKSLQVGVSAQEIEEVLPEIVHTDNSGYKSVDYSKLTALLIEATKEQQKTIETLKDRISALESKK